MINKTDESIIDRVTKKGVFPYQYAFTLLFPLRNLVLSPKKIIQRLELKANHQVLELGPGPGYFSRFVAEALPQGNLVLADVQQGMLDIAKKRLDKRHITNVSFHLCQGDSFPFKDKSFDRIFMVTVLGEVETQQEYVAEFYRMLRKGGILSISEQAGDPDKLSREEITKLAVDAGFVFDQFFGTKRNFTINFRKE